LGPFGTAATNGPIVPASGDYDDGEIGGIIGRGNRSTRRKPAPVPLCPPQTPHAARKEYFCIARVLTLRGVTRNSESSTLCLILEVRIPFLSRCVTFDYISQKVACLRGKVDKNISFQK
jgi:hypothetical protein